jgi:hypothetical protein
LLEVYETDDASLVFTAQACWGFGRRWEVRDANGAKVGSFRSGGFQLPPQLTARLDPAEPHGDIQDRRQGIWMEDCNACLIAWAETPEGHRPAFVLSAEGLQMGQVTGDGTDTLIELEMALGNDPFARMVVMAALITAT